MVPLGDGGNSYKAFFDRGYKPLRSSTLKIALFYIEFRAGY